MHQSGISSIAIIQDLFAFMAALCEEANDIAMQGSAEDDAEQMVALSNNLRETGNRLVTLSNAAIAITQR